MFNEVFARPRFRPAINVGALMDIPSGQYERGSRGEMILNGGLGPFTGITARPNHFKTALGLYFILRLSTMSRPSSVITYDSEGTLNAQSRLPNYIKAMFDEHLNNIDFFEDPRFTFTDLSRYLGDEFFTLLKTVLRKNVENEKDLTFTTPFVDQKGGKRSCIRPSGVMIDSLSKLQVAKVEAMYEKNAIGDSGSNTDAMAAGRAKKQLVDQIPTLCATTGSYMVMTSLLDVIKIDPYEADKRNLSHLKRDTAIKGASSSFYSLPNNLWSMVESKPCLNKDKMCRYPNEGQPSIKGDSDLTEVTVINLRGKGGMSGLPIVLLFSQGEGLLSTLTEFHYIREAMYGFQGNLQNYTLAILPDVKLSRTTVRSKIGKEPRLRRAIQITADMLQIQHFHRNTDPELMCTPEQLYEDLSKMGYDWDQLLDTRSYWVFLEDEKDYPPFLSTMDLLRMRKGLYVPYWFSKEERSKIKVSGGKNTESVGAQTKTE